MGKSGKFSSLTWVLFGSLGLLTSSCTIVNRTTVEAAQGSLMYWEEYTVGAGETLSVLTETWEIPNPSAFIEIAKKNSKHRLISGQKIRIHRTLGPIQHFNHVEFVQGPRNSSLFNWKNGHWSFEEVERIFQERQRIFSGVVDTSLWESAAKAGMEAQLLIRLSEIFAWEIDFSREIQKGDEWRLIAIQYVDGEESKGWKEVLAAEIKQGNEIRQAFLFEDPETGRKGFFNAQGESLEKIFLKSPIKFGRISSRFTRKRFHPVLKVSRPHLGVDYAAPVGTPIMSVGDGVISFSGWSGGGGKVIKVRHNATYTTAYKHLSRISKHVKNGARVRQGEVIGYVGSTGLSTGPHLHFEFLRNNAFVDPLSLKFPSAKPLDESEKRKFAALKNQNTTLLPKWPSELNQTVRQITSTESP